MRLRFAAAALGALLSGNALAAAPAPVIDLPDPRVLLQGLVSEAQVSAAFELVRNALIAVAEGREGAVPEILRRELDRIDADVKLRGTLAGLLLLKELEAEIKSLLESPPSAHELPAMSPFTHT